MAILVTGGAGYIGSHTCLELLNSGYEIVVADNLSNSHIVSLRRLRELTGKPITFYNVDLLDRDSVEAIFLENNIDAVIHLAGYKAVGESVQMPLHYYHNNITGTLILCQVMQKFDVKRMVFSSSATVYTSVESGAISEDSPLGATNPYGRTKLMIEEMLRDLYVSDHDWSISLLRYFNPVGSHVSGRIGEDPGGIPNNLTPYITQVAVGKLKSLRVFGNDYPTPDGTGVRDYIHVVDLALGHLKAIEKAMSTTGVEAYNLGTGKGYSVLEMIRTFEQVSGRKIPYTIVDRRPGDIAVCYADPSKAIKELGWAAQRGIEEMCADAWRWQLHNPNGYEEMEQSSLV
ncbi:UDP-glucose 4-epimerase GalE [Paenibacillus prosopidis]|uniref:UDP-glucose 4-epimerase n=1 Tax=Paenibacillus prosopidis TaxID=630520 RepID=A0A368W1T0_9BACL|nr:UDP-glucose 4-epimerase GalE [Paenibacillus prosopidis]RCW47872.1 UDP-galactose 4-epimerase [Paenibacillus prosopidis]